MFRRHTSSILLPCLSLLLGTTLLFGCDPVPRGNTEIEDKFDTLGAILTASSGELDANDREAMEKALDDAETAYADDDACGASTDMKTFLGLAQGCRTGTMKETAEEMYNLGRMLRYRMVTGRNCPGDETVGEDSEATVEDQDSDNSHMKAVATFSEPTVLTVEEEGTIYTHLQIPGADANMGEAGEPGIPVFRRLIAVPQGAQVSLHYTATEAESIYMNLLPAQPQPVDAAYPQPDPSVFETPPFTQNMQLYMTDAFYPPEPVRITELGDCRGLRMVMLEIFAGQYNPVKEVLVLFDQIDFEVVFHNNKADSEFIPEAALRPFESNLQRYAGAVMNTEAVMDHVAPGQVLPTIDGEELLILTHPDFRAAAEDLARWKNEKGIVTNVFNVMDGAGPGPDTKEAIDDFIEFRYDEAFIRPSYVLLLGDAEFIPVFYVDSNHYEGETIGTDWIYSIYGDFGTDLLPDFAVGRICVDTLPEANIVVQKIINYEKTPPVHAFFYNTAAFAAQFECCRRGTDPGTAKRSFTEICETVRDVMVAEGYVVERIYDATGPATPERYHDGTLLPDDLGPDSGFAWDGNWEDISNAFNDGRFLIMHRDHGWSSGWEHPYYTTNDFQLSVSNGDLLPVVFSVNCASGWFDHETSSPASDEECIVEHFLLMENGGAVGVLGDTRNSPSWANSALTLGFFDAIWPEAAPEFGTRRSQRRLGDILNHGKAYLLTQITVTGSGYGSEVSAGAALDELHLWHVIGDPTLEMWTEQPDYSALSPDAFASIGQNTLRVDYGTEGALVTAFQRDDNDTLIPLGRGTVEGGSALLELINPVDEDEEVELAATLSNAVCATMTLDITPPANVTLLTSVPWDQRIALSWANPVDADFASVRIQRSLFGYPTDPSIGDTVYDGTGESCDDTGLTNGQLYYYVAFAYDDALNYASGIPVNDRPNVPTPPDSVTDFLAVAGDTEVALSWLNPADDRLLGIRIQRRTDTYPTAYDDGVMIYNSDGTSETDTGLVNGTTYYYAAFAYNTNLLYAPGVNVSATPNDLLPPSPVSDFDAEEGDGLVNLSWVNPTDTDFAGVRIQRTIDRRPMTPEDGTNVYDGPAEAYTDHDVVNDTYYGYSAFAYDIYGNYSSFRNAYATPHDMTPPGSPTSLTATPGDGFVLLTWTNPTDPDFVLVAIRRSDTDFPATISDGTLVGSSAAEKYTDTHTMTNGVTYYYSLFARDADMDFSDPAQITAMPQDVTPPGNVTGLTISAPLTGTLQLNWTNPVSTDFQGVRVQRSTKGYPGSPTAGINVYDGTSTGCFDTGLTGSLWYYYTVFTYDEVPNYSSGVQISRQAP